MNEGIPGALRELARQNPFASVALNIAADRIEEQHARGLELAKALSICITAMNPPDRDGISMHEWNQRLKSATKQACAMFDESQFSPTLE